MFSSILVVARGKKGGNNTDGVFNTLYSYFASNIMYYFGFILG